MLDIKLIRKEKEKIEQLIQRKEPDLHLDDIITLDETTRSLKSETESLKARRKSLSSEIGALKKEKKNADDLMSQVRSMGDQISSLDHKLADTEKQFQEALSCIPNIPMDEIKVSQDKEENVCLKTIGEKPQFSFSPKNHVELNEKLHLFDFQKPAKTSGTGWSAYKGIGAQLEWALLSYMIDVQVMNGFEFWLPPLMVRPHIMFGSGQIPKFNGQFYQIDDKEHELYLIPTAEVVLNGLHYDEIIEEDQLPLKYAAYTPCFRKESGAAGAQERGLIRTHQFNKVEMFCYTKPEQSEAMFDQMINVAEQVLEGLQLHYQLSLLVTGDMSFTAAKTVDIEAWLPGQDRYYEVSSISNCTDYQARRSHIRYKKGTDKPELVHTLNGSGLATSRLMVALLESNQNEDGSINLPPVLQEKLGMTKLTPK